MFLLGIELMVASYLGGLLYENFQPHDRDEPKKSPKKMTPHNNHKRLASTQVVSASVPIHIEKSDAEREHLFYTRANMLSIKVGHLVYAIPGEQVQHIDYVDTLTFLPFTEMPIEGLTCFEGHPLVQIDVANALGLEQIPQPTQKRLIVSTSQGNFALRVAEVLDFAKNSSPQTHITTQILELDEIFPPSLKSAKSTIPLPQNKQPLAGHEQQKLTVLLVASGNKTLALFTHNIDHIQEMTDLQTLSEHSSHGELLIKVKDHLLPTYSLGQAFGLTDTEKTETFAVIVRCDNAPWALRVQKVLTLEEVQQVYSSGTEQCGLWYVTKIGQIRELIDVNSLQKHNSSAATSRLWYVTQDGTIQELVDAQDLRGAQHSPLAITITEPQQTASVLSSTERQTTEGLRIFCHGSSYLLPLTMVVQTLKDFDQSSMTAMRFPTACRSNRANRIPWINATAWLFGLHGQTIDSNVVVTLNNGQQILLGVERIALAQALAVSEKWRSAELPYPAGLVFDAASYDENTGQWILRVINTVSFAALPWRIKKALVKAITGWIDCSSIGLKTLPD